MRVRISRRATRQLDAILTSFGKTSPQSAISFLRRFDEVTEALGRFPDGFEGVGQRPGVRRIPLVRFPYLIFYKIILGEVVVLSVIHGARDKPWGNL